MRQYLGTSEGGGVLRDIGGRGATEDEVILDGLVTVEDQVTLEV